MSSCAVREGPNTRTLSASWTYCSRPISARSTSPLNHWPKHPHNKERNNMNPRRRKNSSKVNLTFSVVFHAALIAAATLLAAREGMLGKKLQTLTATIVPKEPKPEPPKPKPEEPKPVAPKAPEPPKLAAAPPPRV